jgi:hypothetical protein
LRAKTTGPRDSARMSTLGWIVVVVIVIGGVIAALYDY